VQHSSIIATVTETDSEMSALDHALARRASADGDLVSGAYVHNSGPCVFQPRRSRAVPIRRQADAKN
jgi:hypothetical protein